MNISSLDIEIEEAEADMHASSLALHRASKKVISNQMIADQFAKQLRESRTVKDSMYCRKQISIMNHEISISQSAELAAEQEWEAQCERVTRLVNEKEEENFAAA